MHTHASFHEWERSCCGVSRPWGRWRRRNSSSPGGRRRKRCVGRVGHQCRWQSHLSVSSFARVQQEAQRARSDEPLRERRRAPRSQGKQLHAGGRREVHPRRRSRGREPQEGEPLDPQAAERVPDVFQRARRQSDRSRATGTTSCRSLLFAGAGTAADALLRGSFVSHSPSINHHPDCSIAPSSSELRAVPPFARAPG